MSLDKLLSKEQILSADDLATEDVDVPEWGGTVRVSEMSGDARDEFEQYMAKTYRPVSDKKQDKDEQYYHIRAPLCAFCIVNEKGDRVFTIKEMDKLGKKNGKVLDRVFEAANKLNKVFGNQREDVEKNSEATSDEERAGE